MRTVSDPLAVNVIGASNSFARPSGVITVVLTSRSPSGAPRVGSASALSPSTSSDSSSMVTVLPLTLTSRELSTVAAASATVGVGVRLVRVGVGSDATGDDAGSGHRNAMAPIARATPATMAAAITQGNGRASGAGARWRPGVTWDTGTVCRVLAACDGCGAPLGTVGGRIDAPGRPLAVRWRVVRGTLPTCDSWWLSAATPCCDAGSR